METVRISRVEHTVWRPWEEERVVEVRGLVEVGEKEEVAEHLYICIYSTPPLGSVQLLREQRVLQTYIS